MASNDNFWTEVKHHPERHYVVHYASQSLFEPEARAGLGALAPRVTSIVVMHLKSGQLRSFATHTIAEELDIAWDQIEANFNQIEKELLTRFFAFLRDRRGDRWIHWNMRDVTYGFEHLEHRYRVLARDEPPTVPVELRFNLNDALQDRFGTNYAPHKRLPNLMQMNDGPPPAVLQGEQEAAAFRDKDYIRMHASTLAKVEFFGEVIRRVLSGRLRTASHGILVWIDRRLESRWMRVAAAFGTLGGAVQLIWSVALHAAGIGR